MNDLAGKRILIVEDEALIAATAADIIADYGGVPVGPAGTIAEALALIAATPIDAAIVDINLLGERSDRVAEALRAASIPFVFATGYGASLAAELGAAVLDKPYSDEKLKAAILSLLA